MLRTGIPMLIHFVGRHFETERTIGSNLPFRLEWEDGLPFAAPMNLRFDASPWVLPWAVAFLNAIAALTL